MHKRVNMTLPEETVRLIDRVAGKGDRSRFVATAVRHFVTEMKRKELRRLLAAGAKERAERDLLIAEEWFPLEEEAWIRNRGR